MTSEVKQDISSLVIIQINIDGERYGDDTVMRVAPECTLEQVLKIIIPSAPHSVNICAVAGDKRFNVANGLVLTMRELRTVLPGCARLTYNVHSLEVGPATPLQLK